MKQCYAIFHKTTRHFLTSKNNVNLPDEQGEIDYYLNNNPDLGVWIGPASDLPDITKDVMGSDVPRPATEAELAQMPAGLQEAKHNTAEEKIQEIAQMSYADVEAWADDVVDLPTAKVRIKKMALVILAILKRQDWSE